MTTLAFIPARGGSKGIPGKNIKSIAGKPLIAWSIEHALRAQSIDRVIVSTDCPEIAKVAKDFGAEVPFMRPKELSGDTATTESAMLHCCDFLKQQNALPETFVLLQATSPIRGAGRLDQALEHFSSSQLDSLLAVTKSHRFTWKNPAQPKASYNYMARPRRQDISAEDQEYLETGSFYITRTAMLMESKNRLCGKVGFFETPEEESYEIDSLMDFVVCEQILKFLKA